MIVDDLPTNLRVLEAMLTQLGYTVQPISNGADALEKASAEPPDIVLLDISMPDMDGFEVCRRFKQSELLRDIPVLFISALSSTNDKLQAFSAGGVDYVTKPFRIEEVHARVKAHLTLRKLRLHLEHNSHSLERQMQEKLTELYRSQLATVFALAKLAERRDNDTGRHVERVQAYSRLLALQLAENLAFAEQIDQRFVTNLFHAAPLHDIGKVAVSDAILLKPGSLDEAEFAAMKTHTTVGHETLESVYGRYPHNGFLGMGVTITRSHHERWDGTGYPDGLAGEAIPLEARIMAVADVYDALRFKRVYKPAYSHSDSCRAITEAAGTHFDPAVVEAFILVADSFDEIARTSEQETFAGMEAEAELEELLS